MAITLNDIYTALKEKFGSESDAIVEDKTNPPVVNVESDTNNQPETEAVRPVEQTADSNALLLEEISKLRKEVGELKSANQQLASRVPVSDTQSKSIEEMMYKFLNPEQKGKDK